MTPSVVNVESLPAVPWRNGGGLTRVLLAWPGDADWMLRISVADVHRSGAFSDYPGVERWFAVLSGGAVRLETQGAAACKLSTAQPDLHRFSGDLPTHCTLLGAPTRDFNVMLRRGPARLRQESWSRHSTFLSSASAIGLFVAQPCAVTQDHAVTQGRATMPEGLLPAMSLAWWHNPQRREMALTARVPADAATPARGWWLALEIDPPG